MKKIVVIVITVFVTVSLFSCASKESKAKSAVVAYLDKEFGDAYKYQVTEVCDFDTLFHAFKETKEAKVIQDSIDYFKPYLEAGQYSTSVYGTQRALAAANEINRLREIYNQKQKEYVPVMKGWKAKVLFKAKDENGKDTPCEGTFFFTEELDSAFDVMPSNEGIIEVYINAKEKKTDKES